MVDVDALLRQQVAYLADRSPWYRERIGALAGRICGIADLPELPLLTKEELRAGQRDDPPFGPHQCAPKERLVRMHVTSGTTGDPVAIGLTARDHEANGSVGGEAFRIAGARPEDTVAHCLNYTLYAGGVADHMALEASGATVVPIGVGQSRRLIELIPALRITAIFGTLSFPLYLAERARELGVEPRSLGLRHLITAGEPGAGLAAVRREIEAVWGASVADTFGMSDVWSTMGAPIAWQDGAEGELVWTHLRREASPLLRYRSVDLATVWTSPCACGRTAPRIAIHGRRDDMLRVRAVNVYPQAIGAILSQHPALGRWRVIASGDPIQPPLRVEVEAPPGTDTESVADQLERSLNARFDVTRLDHGSLPVSEHKTPLVERR
jgi:phenylacetate-CoA ligase